MTKNYPHHRKGTNSIHYIQILTLSDFEVFHVADDVETVENFVVFFSLVPFDCWKQNQEDYCNQDDRC